MTHVTHPWLPIRPIDPWPTPCSGPCIGLCDSLIALSLFSAHYNTSFVKHLSSVYFHCLVRCQWFQWCGFNITSITRSVDCHLIAIRSALKSFTKHSISMFQQLHKLINMLILMGFLMIASQVIHRMHIVNRSIHMTPSPNYMQLHGILHYLMVNSIVRPVIHIKLIEHIFLNIMHGR